MNDTLGSSYLKASALPSLIHLLLLHLVVAFTIEPVLVSAGLGRESQELKAKGEVVFENAAIRSYPLQEYNATSLASCFRVTIVENASFVTDQDQTRGTRFS